MKFKNKLWHNFKNPKFYVFIFSWQNHAFESERIIPKMYFKFRKTLYKAIYNDSNALKYIFTTQYTKKSLKVYNDIGHLYNIFQNLFGLDWSS